MVHAMDDKGAIDEKYIHFSSEGLELEGYRSIFSDGRKHPSAAILHPHTLYGGNMNNNVVLALRDALHSLGAVSLRFNFRGAGGSEGKFANGAGEEKDMENAVQFLLQQKEVDRERLYILGYSFGAAVLLRGVHRIPFVRKLAVVAPPIHHYDFPDLKKDKRPKLVIVGEYDDICQPKDAEKVFSNVPDTRIKLMYGADHFFVGHESYIIEAIQEFLKADDE